MDSIIQHSLLKLQFDNTITQFTTCDERSRMLLSQSLKCSLPNSSHRPQATPPHRPALYIHPEAQPHVYVPQGCCFGR